jgi:hypothetical protein
MSLIDYTAMFVSDTHLAISEDLRKVLTKAIDKHYPHPFRDKAIAAMYAEDIIDKAHDAIGELALDIVSAFDNLPDEDYN